MSGSNRKALIIQFIKFNMVGLLNTAIDFAVFFLLIWLSTHYAVAQALAYLAGMVNSYIWNKTFTFKDSIGSVGRTGGAPVVKLGMRFVMWNGIMLGLSVLLLAIATHTLGLDNLIGKVIVTIVIVFLNFYGSKRWVFVG